MTAAPPLPPFAEVLDDVLDEDPDKEHPFDNRPENDQVEEHDKDEFAATHAGAPSEAARAELAINSALTDCGCEVGSAFLTMGIMVWVVFAWWSGGTPLTGEWTHLLAGGGLVMIFTLMGKALGIWRARLRVVRILQTLTVASMAG